MDTLKTARNLEAKGFTRDQAEAVADAIADTGLASVKRDVDVLKWMIGVLIVLVVGAFWQLFTLSSAVARLDERVATQTARIDRVEQRLTTVEQRLTTMEARLGSMETKLEAILDRLPPRP